MRQTLTFSLAALALLAAPSSAQESLSGRISWSVEAAKPRDDGKVQFTLFHRETDGEHINSRPEELSSLAGLTSRQLSGSDRTPVQFVIIKDAGTFACDGSAGDGRGSGDCRFIGSASFAERLAQQGFGRADEGQLLTLSITDTGQAMFDEVARQGYRGASVADVVRIRNHGVDFAMLREMGALGYKLDSLGALARMRDHGVTAAFIRDVMANGLGGLSPDELIRMRDHGVTPAFVAAVRTSGYDDASVAQLIRLRDHGVTPQFLQALASSGRQFAIDDVIRMRDHGLTPRFVADLRTLGYDTLSPGDMIRLRDHGLSAGAIRRANTDGTRRSPDELIRLRNDGHI